MSFIGFCGDEIMCVEWSVHSKLSANISSDFYLLSWDFSCLSYRSWQIFLKDQIVNITRLMGQQAKLSILCWYLNKH